MLMVAVACAARAAEFKRDIPKAAWEPIFFEEIDRLTKMMKEKPLRSGPLPPGDMEVRVWIGFGRAPMEAFFLHQADGKWTGKFIEQIRRGGESSIKVREVSPKSGWDGLWKRLVKLGLLTLPDASVLPKEVPVMDGTSYVVEINQAGRYRTYEYSNPRHQKWPEAGKILKIDQLLCKELSPE